MHVRNVKSSRSLLDLSHAIIDFASSVLRTWEEHFFRYKVYFALATESIIHYTWMMKPIYASNPEKISAYARESSRELATGSNADERQRNLDIEIYFIKLTFYLSSIFLCFLLCNRVNIQSESD